MTAESFEGARQKQPSYQDVGRSSGESSYVLVNTGATKHYLHPISFNIAAWHTMQSCTMSSFESKDTAGRYLPCVENTEMPWCGLA